MWSEHGWKKITAYERARLHPGGMVSAASGLFMCELCDQYIILTKGEKMFVISNNWGKSGILASAVSMEKQIWYENRKFKRKL